jgi:hypothetical protein
VTKERSGVGAPRTRSSDLRLWCGAILGLTVVAGCGSQAAVPSAAVKSAAPSTSSAVNVVLTGALSGHFTTCVTTVFASSSGPKRSTILRGTVADQAGTEIGTSDFGLVSGDPLRPGIYTLHPDVAAPSGYRAVGTLTVTPDPGKDLPPVTIGQRLGTSTQATFLTSPGSLEVAADGSVAIQADLIDLQATQQTPNHPIISGTWRCASK